MTGGGCVAVGESCADSIMIGGVAEVSGACVDVASEVGNMVEAGRDGIVDVGIVSGRDVLGGVLQAVITTAIRSHLIR
jgi:hypothetical protein